MSGASTLSKPRSPRFATASTLSKPRSPRFATASKLSKPRSSRSSECRRSTVAESSKRATVIARRLELVTNGPASTLRRTKTLGS